MSVFDRMREALQGEAVGEVAPAPSTPPPSTPPPALRKRPSPKRDEAPVFELMGLANAAKEGGGHEALAVTALRRAEVQKQKRLRPSESLSIGVRRKPLVDFACFMERFSARGKDNLLAGTFHKEKARKVAHLLSSWERGKKEPPILLVHGADGSGRRALVETTARSLGFSPYHYVNDTATDLDDQTEDLDRVLVQGREALGLRRLGKWKVTLADVTLALSTRRKGGGSGYEGKAAIGTFEAWVKTKGKRRHPLVLFCDSDCPGVGRLKRMEGVASIFLPPPKPTMLRLLASAIINACIVEGFLPDSAVQHDGYRAWLQSLCCQEVGGFSRLLVDLHATLSMASAVPEKAGLFLSVEAPLDAALLGIGAPNVFVATNMALNGAFTLRGNSRLSRHFPTFLNSLQENYLAGGPSFVFPPPLPRPRGEGFTGLPTALPSDFVLPDPKQPSSKGGRAATTPAEAVDLLERVAEAAEAFSSTDVAQRVLWREEETAATLAGCTASFVALMRSGEPRGGGRLPLLHREAARRAPHFEGVIPTLAEVEEACVVEEGVWRRAGSFALRERRKERQGRSHFDVLGEAYDERTVPERVTKHYFAARRNMARLKRGQAEKQRWDPDTIGLSAAFVKWEEEKEAILKGNGGESDSDVERDYVLGAFASSAQPADTDPGVSGVPLHADGGEEGCHSPLE